MPRLLFISRWFPAPPDNGARLRVFHLLRELARVYEIDLLSFAEDVNAALAAAPALDFCHSVQALPEPVYDPGALRSRLGFFSPLPRWAVATESAAMRAAVVRAVRAASPPDVIVASEIDMARYAARGASITPEDPIRLLEELEVSGYVDRWRGAQGMQRARRALTWLKFRRYVARLLRGFDGVTVVSERERSEVLSLAGGTCPPVEVVPNGVDAALLDCDFGAPEPGALVYNGALTYSANLDAVAYFVHDIFPLVLARRPDARLYVTGKINPDLVARLRLDDSPCRERVTFTGYLDDVRPRVATAWASIAPLRDGGGTRLKILEALALGTPVVSTPKGAEGLQLEPGRDLLLAVSPAEFAAAVLDVLGSPTRRDGLSAAGRQAVADRYTWPPIGARLVTMIEHLRHERGARNAAAASLPGN